MNEKALIEKNKHKTNGIGYASDKGIILAHEVDEHNQMIYVVKRGDIVTVEDFGTARPKLSQNRSSERHIIIS